jgi:hypothetical protein
MQIKKKRRIQVQRLLASKLPDAERITVENVNVLGYRVRVDATKYAAMKRTLLRILPLKGSGLTQAEMFKAVVPHLPEHLFPGGTKAAWWAKTVQLDLEAKRVIVREATKPLRWHRSTRS